MSPTVLQVQLFPCGKLTLVPAIKQRHFAADTSFDSIVCVGDSELVSKTRRQLLVFKSCTKKSLSVNQKFVILLPTTEIYEVTIWFKLSKIYQDNSPKFDTLTRKSKSCFPFPYLGALSEGEGEGVVLPH